MGNAKECSVELKFNPQNNNNTEFIQYESSKSFENLKPITSALILPRNSKLNVIFCHNQPALLGEWYEIKIVIVNEEEFSINQLEIEANLAEDDNLSSK